jgi:hypothetical protein
VFNFRVLVGTVLACAAVVLAACGGGGGGSSGNANVRLANATTTHASLALLANGATAVSATALDSVSDYASVASGGPILQINDATSSSALATLAPSVSQDAHYVVVAYDGGGSLRTTVIAEDVGPAAGTTSLRILTPRPTRARSTSTSPIRRPTSRRSRRRPHVPVVDDARDERLPVDRARTYRVRVTGNGARRFASTRVRHADQPGNRVADFTPTSGGTLVNGALLAQQGAYASARNPGARVRLAAAVGRCHGRGERRERCHRQQRRFPFGRQLRPGAGGHGGQRQRQRRLGQRPGCTARGGKRLDPARLWQRGCAGRDPDRRRQPLAVGDHQPQAAPRQRHERREPSPRRRFAVASNVAPDSASPYGVVARAHGAARRRFHADQPDSVFCDSTLSVPGDCVYTLFMLGDAATPIALLRKDR